MTRPDETPDVPPPHKDAASYMHALGADSLCVELARLCERNADVAAVLAAATCLLHARLKVAPVALPDAAMLPAQCQHMRQIVEINAVDLWLNATAAQLRRRQLPSAHLVRWGAPALAVHTLARLEHALLLQQLWLIWHMAAASALRLLKAQRAQAAREGLLSAEADATLTRLSHLALAVGAQAHLLLAPTLFVVCTALWAALALAIWLVSGRHVVPALLVLACGVAAARRVWERPPLDWPAVYAAHERVWALLSVVERLDSDALAANS